MRRALDTATLDAAAGHYAGHFLLPSQFSKRSPKVAVAGREWALQNLYNAHFKDEFAHLLAGLRKQIGPDALKDFELEVKDRFEPRTDKLFAELLAEKLAVTPEGAHLPGKIGTVQIGGRPIGTQVIEVETLDSIRRRKRLGLPKTPENRALIHQIAPLHWPIYAGEGDERAAESGVADRLPPGTPPLPIGALNTNVSIAFAIAGIDAALDLLDEGTVDGYIDGRTGSQPVDPNAAITGTRLFANDLATPAFGGATDQAPGAQAAAGAIADDTSADATGTVTYCRGSSANTVLTLLNAHIDGSAGLTSGTFDFEFNTDAIVSGATVSFTGWTVTQPQGPTAT